MKVSLIYLAAGNSLRFGSNKLLYQWKGKCLYRHLLDRLETICLRHPEWELLLVTQYLDIYNSCQEVQHGNIHAVFSADSQKGMAYTIRTAAAAAQEAEAYAFFVADQPYFTAASAEAFLVTMEQKQAPLGCVVCNGRYGNPAWFSKKYYAELMNLKNDQGGRKVLRNHWKEAVYFPISDERELYDFDTVSDIAFMD